MSSIAELEKQLQAMRSEADRLRAEIEEYKDEISKREKRLQEIMGAGKEAIDSTPRQPRVRRPREFSLKKLAVRVLTEAGKPLTVDEVVQGVRAIDTRHPEKDPTASVRVVLYKDKDVFAKTGRGLFTLAAQGPAPAPTN